MKGSGRRADRIALLAVVAAVLWQLAPLLTPPYATQAIVGTDTYRSHDWLEVAKLDFYARKSLLEWGQIPWWNPLLAGGTPQFSHPSDGTAGPMILPSLLVGETLGMKLNLLLVALAGALGVLLLLRRVIGVSPAAAAVGAVAYAWSGWLPSRAAVGFYESCLMAAWPIVLALWLMPGEIKERRRRWAVAAVIVWALAVQLQLALPVLVLFMIVIAATAAVQRRLAKKPIDKQNPAAGLTILALGGLLGAIKFLPMLDLLGRGDFREARLYPTHPDAWYRSFDQLWYALFHRVPAVPLYDADGAPRVQEYMTLQPGLGALVLAAFGAVVVARRWRIHKATPFLVAGALFLYLSFGPWAPLDAFRGIRLLPLFGSMRGPLRYFNYPILLMICLLAGVGMHQAGALLRHRKRALWAAGIAVLLCLPASLDSRSLYRSSFLYAAETLPTPTLWRSEGLSTRSGARSPTLNLRKYGNVRRGVPTIYVPEDIPMEVPLLPAVWIEADGKTTPEPKYIGEAWVLDATAGRAEVVAWRGAELETAHTLTRPATVVLNQNTWDGWTCGDRAVTAHAGRLAFEAPAGEGLTTTCRWRPPGLAVGASLSLLGLVGTLALWPWTRRRPGRRTL
ncbi:MAG: hypothetical protein GY898_27120 [Proteobacteria bacterium]|nr:hypothetical protein [Pseudomonadota bacterium]